MPIEYYDKIAFEDTRFPVKAGFGVRIKEGHVGALTRLTWHEEPEFKLFLTGGAKLQVGNEVLTVEDGDVVLINPCEPHSTISVVGECEYNILITDVGFLREKTDGAEIRAKFFNYAEGKIRFNHLIRGNKRVKQAAEALFSELKRGNDTAIKGVLMWLYAALFEEEVNSVSDSFSIACTEQLKKIQPAVEYANAHYNEPVSLDTLAEQCMLSPAYFSKLFKEAMRVNPKDYLNQLRMNSAESLLLGTDKKLSEIAWECGMEDACYFSRWFKKNKGMTPGEYKNKEKLK